MGIRLFQQPPPPVFPEEQGAISSKNVLTEVYGVILCETVILIYTTVNPAYLNHQYLPTMTAIPGQMIPDRDGYRLSSQPRLTASLLPNLVP